MNRSRDHRQFLRATSLSCALACAACDTGAEAASARPTPATTQPKVSAPALQAAPETNASDAASGVLAELGKLDPRTPVPLQPMMAWHQKQNMMEHLVAIQRIVDATGKADWAAVAEASAMIESSPQMQQMCEHMGAGAPGFTELALEFHTRADAIGAAADAKDAKAVLQATSHTLQACTGCHAAYRQELVDAETWQARTGAAHDPAAMHSGHGGSGGHERGSLKLQSRP